jgi:hypothetical protein
MPRDTNGGNNRTGSLDAAAAAPARAPTLLLRSFTEENLASLLVLLACALPAGAEGGDNLQAVSRALRLAVAKAPIHERTKSEKISI